MAGYCPAYTAAAIIATGSVALTSNSKLFKYRVNTNDVLTVEKLEGDIGETLVFEEVLMVGGEDGLTIGAPTVQGASVAAEVVKQQRDDKVIAFKKRHRQNSKRKRGHRQHQTVVQISEILMGGAKPSKAGKPAKAALLEETAPAPAADFTPAWPKRS